MFFLDLILENIEYDHLCREFTTYREDLDEIVELMVETVCAKRKTTRIAGSDFPHEVVRSRFLKLDCSHIEFVMDCLQKNTTQVERITLFHAVILDILQNQLPIIFYLCDRHRIPSFPFRRSFRRCFPEALMKLCSDLLAEREANISLRKENAQLEGKAAFYDLFIDLKHSTNLRTTAKELDVPERRFVRFLIERRFVYRTASGNVLPYANVKNAGLFCVKDYCNHGHTGSYTLVTPQGKLYFAQLREMILLDVSRSLMKQWTAICRRVLRC